MVVSTRTTDPSAISIRSPQASFPCLDAEILLATPEVRMQEWVQESTIVNLLRTHISHALFSGSTVFAVKLTPTAASAILGPGGNAARRERSSTNPSASTFMTVGS